MRRYLLAASLLACAPSALADVAVPRPQEQPTWEDRCAGRLEEARRTFLGELQRRGIAFGSEPVSLSNRPLSLRLQVELASRARLSAALAEAQTCYPQGWSGSIGPRRRSGRMTRTTTNLRARITVENAEPGLAPLFVEAVRPAIDACLADALR